MNNIVLSIKNFTSRLTVFSWVIIIVLLVGFVTGLSFLASKNNSQPVAAEPEIETQSGLIENYDDLPPVTEGDDTTGEILPPNTQPPAPSGEAITVL